VAGVRVLDVVTGAICEMGWGTRAMNEFDNETEWAREIVRDRPPYWQFHLASELLRSKIAEIEKTHESLNQLGRPITELGNATYLAWILAMIPTLPEALASLRTGVTGMSFQSGTDLEIKEPLEIKYAVDRLISAYEKVLSCEITFNLVEPPEMFKRIAALFHQTIAEMLEPVRRIPDQLVENIQAPIRGGTFPTTVRLDLSSLDAIIKELSSLFPIIESLDSSSLDAMNKDLARINKEVARMRVDLDLSRLYMMSGLDFERFLEAQFREKGFKVRRTRGSGDFGADLIIETTSGTRAAVQAKRFKQKTNLKAVQEVVGSLSYYSVDFGIVIAASGFLPSAIKLAKSNKVELWDKNKLIRFLNSDFSFSLLSDERGSNSLSGSSRE